MAQRGTRAGSQRRHKRGCAGIQPRHGTITWGGECISSPPAGYPSAVDLSAYLTTFFTSNQSTLPFPLCHTFHQTQSSQGATPYQERVSLSTCARRNLAPLREATTQLRTILRAWSQPHHSRRWADTRSAGQPQGSPARGGGSPSDATPQKGH